MTTLSLTLPLRPRLTRLPPPPPLPRLLLLLQLRRLRPLPLLPHRVGRLDPDVSALGANAARQGAGVSASADGKEGKKLPVSGICQQKKAEMTL